MRRWLEGEFELVASAALLAELERVLGYRKIERRLSGVPQLRAALGRVFGIACAG